MENLQEMNAHGEHEAPCGPILGMQQHAHRMSVFTYVFNKENQNKKQNVC